MRRSAASSSVFSVSWTLPWQAISKPASRIGSAAFVYRSMVKPGTKKVAGRLYFSSNLQAVLLQQSEDAWQAAADAEAPLLDLIQLGGGLLRVSVDEPGLSVHIE